MVYTKNSEFIRSTIHIIGLSILYIYNIGNPINNNTYRDLGIDNLYFAKSYLYKENRSSYT